MVEDTTPIKLAEFDWPWKSENGAGSIILISDEQFTNLASYPDQAVEKPAPWFEQPVSLRDYCRQLAAQGATKVLLAYDYFFGGSRRSLYPDTAAFQETLKKIHDVAAEFGLGLEPSILSPLELGVGYQAKTGESGRWMHYAEGLRDPLTGAYSVLMWQHIQWCNNKGPTPVTLVGARAFAFTERNIPGTPLFAVDPQAIVELPAPHIEPYPGTTPLLTDISGTSSTPDSQFKATRVRVWGTGPDPNPVGDRVLVVLLYRTVEMDYFSPSAARFLDELVQEYHARGISLAGLYSDEMHIQQDWAYHHHLDAGQFTVRYVSPGFEKAFAEKFGPQYADFAKYLVYFACHQHNFLPTHEPKLPSQHVFGPRVQEIAATFLFRRNYYDFLEHSVIALMQAAKEKLEQLNGHPLEAFYHSTWAESPTCDLWAIGGAQMDWSPEEHRRKYEYTPDFVWSNTVQQASAACANYFAWNEFLSGGNNDVPEGGFADRNYYARALACSLAALNRQPLPSAGMWGMPDPVAERMIAVSQVYGALGHPAFRAVQDYAGRSIEVLFVYPQDLVAVDERFGSWMVQYGYANYITAEKLARYGRLASPGWLAVKEARYRAVCVLYEPFPAQDFLYLLRDFVHHGGTLVWSSTPPMLGAGGEDVQETWMADMFGARLEATPGRLGLPLPGRQVTFEGALAEVAPQVIFTDFPVDRVFPVTLLPGTEGVASLRSGGASPLRQVGARRRFPDGGQAVYLGFRPRDDQSASTGAEARAWFEILNALGAYPPSAGSGGSVAWNDNPTVVSRTTGLLACAFPNGAIALCTHYALHEETWPGGFFRKAEDDARALEQNPLPDDRLELAGLRVAGQVVTFRGRHALAWRRGAGGKLVAFAGAGCTGIELDGRRFHWSQTPLDVAWHPLRPEQQVAGVHALYRVWVSGEGRVSLPLELEAAGSLEVWLGASAPPWRERRRSAPSRDHVPAGYGLRKIPFQVKSGDLILDVDEAIEAHWLYVVQRG